jgi:alkylated DNA repair dioxygenase AlkB
MQNITSFEYINDFANDEDYENVVNIQIIDPKQKQSKNTKPYLIHKPPIKFMGKLCKQNRNVGFFSNESKGYNYSNQTMSSQPLQNWMEQIISKVNGTLGTNFNGILINHYENGTDYISAHRDDEKGLDKNKKAVASISFGVERKFRIRDNKKKIVMDLPTQNKMLMVMCNDFQRNYTHEIPIERKVKGERWSLTFRHHLE